MTNRAVRLSKCYDTCDMCHENRRFDPKLLFKPILIIWKSLYKGHNSQPFFYCVTVQMPPKSRQTPYQPSHAFDFGLKVVERDPNTKEVVSCHCEFCVYYGREAKVGSKRRNTTNIQYFKKTVLSGQLQEPHGITASSSIEGVF